MQMAPTPDQHRFYSGLLFELGAPHNPAAGLASLERLARDILRRVAPRVLIVDEVHHLLAGTYRKQRAALWRDNLDERRIDSRFLLPGDACCLM